MKDKLQTILVTGCNGQLGNEFKILAPKFPYCQFLFAKKDELDIANESSISKYFAGHSIEYIVNCAAYTAVDKAEQEKKLAFLINGEAVGLLAYYCKKNGAQLIHLSTDYVFDGNAKKPYLETDETCPINVYGTSKLNGEEQALKNDRNSIIIRTSWLYSSFGNNFVKTMLRLMQQKEAISVVNDQYGAPTYAADLALAIMRIIKSGKSRENGGIYNYANSGVANWFQFASAIKELSNADCIIHPISTAEYPTAAKRPPYSVLDTSKILQTFETINIRNWKDALRSCLSQL